MNDVYEANMAIRRLAYALSHGAPFNQSAELARAFVTAYDAIDPDSVVNTGDPKQHWITLPDRLPPVG